MKRFTLSRLFLSLLNDEDIVIIAGKSLCEEAYRYDKKGYFYIKRSNGIASSVALGIAMNTDKRVFILCSDYDFLKEMGSVPQIAVSKCTNIFYVLFNEGIYSDDGGGPTIYREMSAAISIFFNCGFTFNDYSDYFYKKGSMKTLKNSLDRAKGPRVINIYVDEVCKKFDALPYSEVELKNRISEFICN